MLTVATKIQRKLATEVGQVIARSAGRDSNNKPALLVGYSGGLDSHVLLLLARQWCIKNPPATLRAMTIDHGLQKDSAAWSQHCEQVCKQLEVGFEAVRVEVDCHSGLSPEEAARNARYAAFKDRLNAGEYLLTAHHADDQAETVMLQLLRGAGVKGLSAMPERKSLGAGLHLRPLLSVSRSELEQLAGDLDLTWIEDPSNADEKFDRNLLRQSVMPMLRQRWPAMAVNLSRSAGHCARAAALNRDLAVLDLGDAIDQGEVALSPLQTLDAARRKNAIRVWVEQQGYQPPSTAQLDRIDADLVCGSPASAGQVSFGMAAIRRYSDQLFLSDRSAFEEVPAFSYSWACRKESLVIVETGQILNASDLDLPWLAEDKLLHVRSRAGGERIRLSGRKNSQSVKSLLQQNRIPPWRRARLPLLFVDECLVGIVGIGFSDRPESVL